ncbi:MAG: hypothetical protein ABJE95_32150 [Byssovorax sp.]
MPPSQPPSSKSLDAGWGLFSEQPDQEDDDTRTVQMSSPLFRGAPSFDDRDGTSDERDTMPPPVPVSEYVQTMMEQAIEEPEPSGRPPSATFSWGGALPPSSRKGAASERDRGASPPPRRVDSWSVPATLSPPVADVDDGDDELGGFRLVAHEPERLGGARGDVEDPRFRRGSAPAPGFDDLPFDDVIAASERAAAGPRFPTPVPVLPSSRTPLYAAPPVPPSSRREPPFPSVPPILGASWGSGGSARDPLESEHPVASPPTKRGLAAEAPHPRANPGTQRYGSIGDASVMAKPPSTQRAPIMAPRAAPPPLPVDPFDDVRELYDAGDFRSALVMAEALLEAEPELAEARACAVTCRETLSKKYLSRLGGLAKILRVAMPPDEIRWLSLDHKAGFLLSCIDGTSSIEEVLDVACMQQFEAIRILHDFRELGVIEILADPRSSRR